MGSATASMGIQFITDQSNVFEIILTHVDDVVADTLKR